MAAVIDALAQWDALAQREAAAGYQYSPLPLNSCCHGQNTTKGCPSAWREKIVEWCFRFVDQCELGRDVVSYTMSYFDRLVPHYSINDKIVQLVAMTCLYLAVKVHCSKKISPECMVALSGCSFQHEQVVKMELIVLRGLNWHVYPATSPLFLEIFFSTSTDDVEAMTEIKEAAIYLLELAICDSFFISINQSSISRAAILAAMDIVARPLRMNVMMENLLNDDKCMVMVEKCSLHLQQIYCMIVKQDTSQEIIPEREVSPTSVFGMS